uniref:Uncharacterized protein n=2 Tax=Rhizophora mucronata TaxID=61149 RepID=A0A2P2K908_RHIMU
MQFLDLILVQIDSSVCPSFELPAPKPSGTYNHITNPAFCLPDCTLKVGEKNPKPSVVQTHTRRICQLVIIYDCCLVHQLNINRYTLLRNTATAAGCSSSTVQFVPHVGGDELGFHKATQVLIIQMFGEASSVLLPLGDTLLFVPLTLQELLRIPSVEAAVVGRSEMSAGRSGRWRRRRLLICPKNTHFRIPVLFPLGFYFN